MVSDQAFPAWGGEGIATQNLCRELARRGHKLLVLTSRVPAPPREEGIEIIRFPGLFVPKKGYFAVQLYTRIQAILKERKIEVVQVNLPTFLGWQVFVACKNLNIPKIAGIHVQTGNVLPVGNTFFSLLERPLRVWFSFFYNNADLLISPSLLGKKILSRYCRRKIEVVSNGVNLDVFNYFSVPAFKIQEFRKKFSLTNHPFILYVGRLSREKNVEYLLKIASALKKEAPELKLLIVGQGELKQKLHKKIITMNLISSVILAGFLPLDELLCAYREALIFILPSLYELQCIACLEALAMGNPLLVAESEENAARELVLEGYNGYLFSLENVRDPVEKIKKILDNPELRKSMQEVSFSLAKKHDIRLSISKMEKIYSDLI